jgi:hypothetical protein
MSRGLRAPPRVPGPAHREPPCWLLPMIPSRYATGARLPYKRHSENSLRARTDDGPELGTVHRLHVGGEPSVAVDPFLHRLRVVGQHVGGGPRARHLDPGREPSVDKGRVKPEARAGGDADPVKRDDAQDQGAGGVANAVDDHPFAAVADGGVFELVLMDEAAVVLPDAVIRTGAATRCGDRASRAHNGQEEIRKTQTGPTPTRRAIMPYPGKCTLTPNFAFRGEQSAPVQCCRQSP